MVGESGEDYAAVETEGESEPRQEQLGEDSACSADGPQPLIQPCNAPYTPDPGALR